MKKVIHLVYIVALTYLFNILFLTGADVEQLCNYFIITAITSLFILYLISKLKKEDIVNDDMIYFITMSMVIIQGSVILKLLPTDISGLIKFIMLVLYLFTGVCFVYKHANIDE